MENKQLTQDVRWEGMRNCYKKIQKDFFITISSLRGNWLVRAGLVRQIASMKQKAFASFWPSKGSPCPGKGQ
ncbi:hypothetical protein PQ465_12765 [Sphingobacterium oryzagri]|uniref:Uncharacterized protein n=1 Tax=Sphingobacterium oryzagri TaxID=3025669 RepID=A0ABY7WBX8_9SPHI|nr:hypothetical protein [Sphingobacterium sp. KACC 22765]WDF67176.1 hypothetical protein PQ465_12765 [Sphingobacterium sp. KACC 22765]